ncbi:hypothetical protein LZ32DRAFT_595856 [Colletotrichum eremochloae]|nr:hypothetical protein LZ32DRAFT_595856 [Colletotrichum eremochloae]
MPPPNQNSCVACARRKVKCDKLSPCSSCSKMQSACIYRPPVPSQRHRRRLTQGDLLSKIQELESILHSHGIPFDPLGNSWIPSAWEDKFTMTSRTQASPGTSVELLTATEDPPTAAAVEDPNQSAYGDAISTTGSIFFPAQISTMKGQLELHPNPKHVFELWQTFANNVNPLAKIIHAPTLQEKIIGAAWNAESIGKPLEATMFAVYALAITSMKPADCVHIFGEGKTILLSRYRSGALRALSGTDLLLTRDLDVLLAFVLILMLDPQSEFSITAIALALRIAHKLGLHRAGEDTELPFFQQEMQVRLWWYIRGLNSRARRGMGLLSTIDDLDDVRLPMNVNDADLHPDMANPPAVQHTAATEMVYCLLKYDLWTFVRKSANFSGSLNPRENAAKLITLTSAESMAKKRKVLGEVNRMLQEKYLVHLDPNIPLHRLSAAMAGIAFHRQRFLMFHPRHQPEGGRYMSQADRDDVFESSVRLLEFDLDVRNTSFSTNLVDHMACQTPVEALVYTVSELRRRMNGHLVDNAWTLLEEMHSGHWVVLQSDQNHTFYTALTNLILEAWEFRSRVLELGAEALPKFIKTLQASKQGAEVRNEPSEDIRGHGIGFVADSMYDESLDWNFWNDLLEL